MRDEADIQEMYDKAKKELSILREQFGCESAPFVREMLETRIISKQAYVYALGKVLDSGETQETEK